MNLVDTNIVLRYLLDDHPEMSAQSRDILQSAQILLTTQVIAEIIYVLNGVYNVKRQEITIALHQVIEMTNVHLENNEVTRLAIREYAETNLDFVDLLLYALHQVTGMPVKTFDKGLLRKLG